MKVYDKPITFLDLHVLMIEKGAAALVVEQARDLELNFTLLVRIVYQ